MKQQIDNDGNGKRDEPGEQARYDREFYLKFLVIQLFSSLVGASLGCLLARLL